ncbi:hypothetical protein AB0K89_10835 [Streptomyces cinnamoneus]|uniref:hypothetical protein n=1 Tax=Streptomyces cinnamoneus TaxID=53446 RepID=UPI003412F9D3
MVQLLRMDQAQAGSEAEILAQFESLWSAADREKSKRIALPDVPAARAFTARLHTLVLAPLTTVTDISERLHHAGSRMKPGALTNIASGIRPPTAMSSTCSSTYWPKRAWPPPRRTSRT